MVMDRQPGPGPGPLYGLAVDLTPFDVLATAQSGAPPSAVRPLSPMLATTRTVAVDRVVVLGSRAPTNPLAFAAVAAGAVVLMMFVPSRPPTPANAARVTMAPGPAEPASVPAAYVLRTPPLEKTGATTTRRVIPPEVESAGSRPDQHPSGTGKEQPAEALAATLQRLQAGFR
jgi:hypothetical protein